MHVVRPKVDGTWRTRGRAPRVVAGLALVASTAIATPSAASPGGTTTSAGATTTASAVEAPGTTATPGAAGGFSRPVYVTNSANNDGVGANVARFTTGPDGRLTLAETVPAGFGARGMVFAPDLRHAYLVSSQADELRTYDVAPDGALTLDTVTPTDGPVAIAIHPEGQTLYVANVSTGTLSVFAIQPDGGLLLRQRADAGAPEPKEPAVTPDGRFLYVGHGTPDDTEPTVVTGYAIAPDGTLGAEVARADAGTSSFEAVVTPNGRFLYVVHQVSDDVFGYRIEADGDLTPIVHLSPGEFLEGAGISPDGRLLYLNSFGGEPAVDGTPDPTRPSKVHGFRIGADGQLTPVFELAVPDPIGFAFAPDGRRLYVSSFSVSRITTFAVAPSGRLTQVQSLPSGGPLPAFHSVTVLPNRSPSASFTATGRRAGTPSRFDASASADQDGHVARYQWDFGDGTTRADGGPRLRHTYARPGTYTVRLTVTDDEGCSTHRISTGQDATCLGSPGATTTRTVVVP